MLANAADLSEARPAAGNLSELSARSAPVDGAVERRLLRDDIAADTTWQLLIVQAPAGYGKSTLIAQLLQTAPDHVYLDLKSVGDDHLALCAVRDAFAGAGENAVVWVDVGSRSLGTFPEQLARLLGPSSRCRMILESRQHSKLDIVPALRSGSVKVLTTEDLCFDLAETRQLLAAHGLDPEEEYLLHCNTGGWPFGLAMMCRALNRGRRGRIQVRRESGFPREIDEFFAHEFAEVTSDTRDLLLIAGMSEIVNCHSLSAGLDAHVAEDTLDQLVDHGLFIDRVPCVRGSYCLHPLFRRWLRDQARTRLDPARWGEVHRRLAQHFSVAKDARHAIDHLIEAGELTAAADVFAAAAADLVRDERLGDIVDFVERLPTALFAERLPIITAATIAYSMRRQSAQAQAMIELCRREITAHPENADGAARLQALTFFVLASQDKNNEVTRAARRCLKLAGSKSPFDTGMSLNVEGRWLCSVQQYEQAEDALLRAEARHEADHSMFGGSYQKGFLSTVYIEQGRVEEASLLLTRALRQAESRDTRSIVGSVISAYLSQVLYEKNEVHKAGALLIDYLPLIQQQGFIDTVALAHMILARSKAALDSADAATDILGQGLAMGHKYDLPRLSRCMTGELVRLAVLAGDFDHAERRLASEAPIKTRNQGEELVFHPDEAEGLSLGLIRLRIHQGRGDEIKALLAHERRLAVTARRKRRLARIQTLLAMLHADHREDKASGRAMLEAVRIAQRCNLSRTLLDEGPKAVAILSALYDSLKVTADDPEVRYLEGLLRSAGVSITRAGRDGEAMRAALTPRESELLRLVAIGLSNAELGRRISVSENTVKYHLKNLFLKCGISRRIQAVAVAKAFDLVA